MNPKQSSRANCSKAYVLPGITTQKGVDLSYFIYGKFSDTFNENCIGLLYVSHRFGTKCFIDRRGLRDQKDCKYGWRKSVGAKAKVKKKNGRRRKKNEETFCGRGREMRCMSCEVGHSLQGVNNYFTASNVIHSLWCVLI
jgi:hypothetical protein